VDELGIGTDRNDLGADLLEPIILLCQSSKFGRSDEGEIRRVEEENRPFARAFELIELDRAEFPLDRIVGLDREGRHFLPDLENMINHWVLLCGAAGRGDRDIVDLIRRFKR
jgi:hypothetical protein